jgi:hypothetical protein
VSSVYLAEALELFLFGAMRCAGPNHGGAKTVGGGYPLEWRSTTTVQAMKLLAIEYKDPLWNQVRIFYSKGINLPVNYS